MSHVAHMNMDNSRHVANNRAVLRGSAIVARIFSGMSHTYMSHVTHMNESHVTRVHLNESRHVAYTRVVLRASAHVA